MTGPTVPVASKEELAAPPKKGKLITPFNVFTSVVVVVAFVIAVIRFTKGLGAVTNLSNDFPWGLWIGFDVLCGVALAAGGYTIAATVHIFRLEQYRPILRPAILTGFLGYFFVVVGLLLDLGRPWRIVYPVFYTYGVASVMFLVAWHVFLYLTCQFIEFAPAICEWRGWDVARRWFLKAEIGACIAGVILSTLHQSALGALFLLAPTKLYPLWYSPLLPLFFFISSIIAGLAVVILESSLSHRIFKDRTDPRHAKTLGGLHIGLAEVASFALLAYFFLKWIGVAHGQHWNLLATPLGSWFLVEVFIFVLLPCLLFAWAAREKNVRLVVFTSVLTVVGIIINRLNVSIIGFRWNAVEHYIPAWSEVVVTVAIVAFAIATFRWIVTRMPVLREHPDYPDAA